jgi:hypothetical protein
VLLTGKALASSQVEEGRRQGWCALKMLSLEEDGAMQRNAHDGNYQKQQQIRSLQSYHKKQQQQQQQQHTHTTLLNDSNPSKLRASPPPCTPYVNPPCPALHRSSMSLELN